MITEIIIKHFQNTATTEEQNALLAWVEDSEENKQLFATLKNTWVISNLADTNQDKEVLRKKFNILLEKIEDLLESEGPVSKNNKRHIIRVIMRFAAVIVLTACITTILSYTFWHKAEPLLYNQLEVPCGQQAKLTLSDGSKIWLNAKSKLIYPARFSGLSREVVLDGEGFFEVTHNEKKPFIIKTSTLKVKVLGTSFNVSSYNNDSDIKIALVNGSVSMLNPINDQEISRIEPNEMAIYSKKDHRISVKEVETYLYSSWRDGHFKFRKMSLEEISKRLSRNYNVKFVFQNNNLKSTTFNGSFYNYEPLEQILKILKTNTSFKFTIQKDTVIIK